MSSFVRASKFRHVYCDPPRPDSTFQNLRLSTVTGEQNYIKANSLFFAVGVQGGGGPFLVKPLDQPGKLEPDHPIIAGHSAAVLDFEFNNFNDHIVCSCSEDQTIKVWGIPEGGLTENITTPLVDLHGHGRKVTLLAGHPTAANVLASAGADQHVKLWDIEKGCEINTLIDVHETLIQDIVWDYHGNNYATSSKDKNVRIHDARTGRTTGTINTAHEGVKSIKMTYTGNMDKLVTVGFTRQSQRQFKIWDPRKLDAEIKRIDIDQAAGVIMPFYDPDTCVLYLAGKGDGNIRYYEMVNEAPHCFPVNEHRSAVSAKGMAWVPKKGLNIMGCETARLLKLTTNTVEPLSFFVPRKSEAFQDDIYPDTFAGVPSHTADEWLAGSDKPPVLMSLNPANRGSQPAVAVKATAFVPQKTPAQLKAELEAAEARIKVLEERLAAAGLSTD